MASAREKTKITDTAAETSSGNPSVSSSENVASQFGEAYKNLARGLSESILSSNKQRAEAAASYGKLKEQIQQEATQRATEAYHEYAKAAQAWNTQENGQQVLADAYQNYVATLQGLQEDTSRRLTEACQDLVNKGSQTAADNGRQVRQQYVDYWKNVQRVWSSIDVESLVA